jgi:oligopeptide transport system substrate-binding protein
MIASGRSYLFVFLCLLWPFLPACSKREPAAAASHVLRIAQRNEPATLDPHLATLPDEFFVIRALSEGLVLPSPDGGNPLPAVAFSWSISADGRVYTFELRPEARWSNGDPVTAGDFVYSVHRVLSAALAAPKAALFFPLKNAEAFHAGRAPEFSAVGIHALTDHRLAITLAEPTADFLAMLASGPWIPVHPATIEKFGRIDQRGTAWTQPQNFVGNGPFRLKAWRANQEITVERSPTFRDPASVKLDQVRFLAFDNGESEERAFRAGQVDVTMSVPFTKLATYRQDQPALLHQIPLHETRYLVLNPARPPLNDPRVRRALALALDRKTLVEKVLLGGQQPAYSFIPPGLGGYTPDAVIAENSVTARDLLRAAGFPGGQGFPPLELSTWPVSLAQLEAIQQMWKRELGIDITLTPREARTHLAALTAGDFSIALITAIPDYNGVSELGENLRSADPANYARWANVEFDRLTLEAGRTASEAGRLALYQRAEKLLLEDMPVIPLYFNTQNFLLRPNVKNWQTDRLWTRFYQNVSVE